MVCAMWDPVTYLRFDSERARPFFDLLARVHAAYPSRVVDLGCGPGNLTALLTDRWPGAQVLGVDNSPEMIEAAKAEHAAAGERLAFIHADIRTWQPSRPVDVFTCNAALQWIPGHADLLTGWAAWLAPRGSLAFQVPGNSAQPSHQILAELAASARWRPLLKGVQLNSQSANPAVYLDLLAAAGLEVDAWETTYLHVLPGPDPVVDWYKGSGLRPVLAALPPEAAAEFTAEYSKRIREAYPQAPYGTVLPFRRVFIVAHH
jgi:trans-aconitate 2-methyltransferase